MGSQYDSTESAGTATVDVTQYGDLVGKLIGKIFKGSTRQDRDEAEAVAYLGLCEAADKYRPDRGTFKRYAGRFVYNRLRMLKHRLFFERAGVSLSHNNLRWMGRMDTVKREIGRFPTYEETGIKNEKFTPRVYANLKGYYEAFITRNVFPVDDDSRSDTASNRRVGVATEFDDGPLVTEWTAGDNSED